MISMLRRNKPSSLAALFGLLFAAWLAAGQTSNYPQSALSPAFGTDTGSSTAYSVSLSPCPQSLKNGSVVVFFPANANTSTTPTLNVCGLGAKTVTKLGASALALNDLVTTSLAIVYYDGTNWELQDPNTASGGGMVYPGAGVVVSTGSGWGTSLVPSGYTGVPQEITQTSSGVAAFGPGGILVDTQSGASPSVSLTDRLALLNLTNSTGGTALTVPQSGATNFDQYFAFVACNSSTASTVTATPTTSTVNGAATLTIQPTVTSGSPGCAFFYGNNTNYIAADILPTNANGRLALPNIAQVAADSLLMNITAGTASATAVSLDSLGGTNSCAGATNALTFNSSTHVFGCNTISSTGVSLSSITAATGANSINNGNNDQTWNWSLTSSGAGLALGENVASTAGTANILQVSTLSGSTAGPVQFTAQGTTNGVFMNTNGLLQASGTGGINATLLNGNTYPASGALTAGGVLCPSGANTVTSSAALGNGQIVTGSGTSCPGVANINAGSGIIKANTATVSITYQGGQDTGSNVNAGGGTFKGASILATGTSASTAGYGFLTGGNNSSTAVANLAGTVEVLAGQATGTSNAAHQGLHIFSGSWLKGTTVTAWNLQCSGATAETTQDCAASPANIIGVAANVGTIAVSVYDAGDSPINASAAVTVGDSVCAGTTAGKVTDSGGTGACSTGLTVGHVKAVSGAWTFPDGATATLSTTLPLIHWEYSAPSSGSGGGDTITSPNSTLTVGGTSSATTLDVAGSTGEILAGATPALTYTPTLGKSGTAGTLSLFPASGNFTTTLGSAATASNTVNFFASVPTNLHLFYCAVSSTTCTLTDTGYAYNSIPNADLANSSTTVNSQTCTLGSSCTIPEQVNSSSLTSQAGWNLLTSTTNAAGLIVTPTNSATNQLKFEITGPLTTLGDLAYGGSGGAFTRLAGPTSVNGVPQFLTETPSGGAATAETWAPAGVTPNPQTGTTYTYVATDRASYVTFSNSSSIAVTLPQAGSTGFASNWVNLSCDIGTGTATITPTTSTISWTDGSAYHSAQASMALSTGYCAWIYSDNTNYFAVLRSGGGSSLPSGGQGNPLVNASGSTTYATSALWYDASQFTGSHANDLCDKIRKVISTLSTPTSVVIDARALTGSQSCAVNPFIDLLGTGMAPNITGTVLFGPGVITETQPMVSPNFKVFGMGPSAGPNNVGTQIVAGSGFPNQYTTGTATNTVSTGGSSVTYTTAITGSGTTWSTNVVPGEEYVACGSGPTQAGYGSACGGTAAANACHGVITAVNSNTSLTIINNNSCAANSSAYNYVIYGKVAQLGDEAGDSAQNQNFQAGFYSVELNCEGKTGCVALANYSSANLTGVDNIVLHGQAIGLDWEGAQTQNSGPPGRIWVVGQTGQCSASSMGVVIRTGTATVLGTGNISSAMTQCNSGAGVTTNIAVDAPMHLGEMHTLTQVGTNTGTDVLLGGAPTCPTVCVAAPTAVTSLQLDDVNCQANSLDCVQVGTNGSPKNYHIGGIKTNSNVTNTFVDNNTSCTIVQATESTLGEYDTNSAGAIAYSTSATCKPPSYSTGGSTAGGFVFGQGSANSTATTSVTLQAPASVTSYVATLPGAIGSAGQNLQIASVGGSTATLQWASGTSTICSGSQALPTAAISSGTKYGASSSTPLTITCTGLATTDNIQLDFDADPSGVTGYGPSASGMLTIVKYPTANTINIYLYNNTSSSITPGAMTVNYRVVR